MPLVETKVKLDLKTPGGFIMNTKDLEKSLVIDLLDQTNIKNT
jgi:hypothetical protein